MYSEDEEYQQIFTLAESYKDKLITSIKNWIRIEISDIKVGDEIIIYFYPDSQPNICTLFPKFGQVVKIEPDIQLSNNFYSEQTLEHLTLKYNETEYNAAHSWYLSDYSNSHGYTYDIYRLDDISIHSVNELTSKTNFESINNYNQFKQYGQYDPEQNESLSDSENENEQEYDSGYDSFG
jgi:hypothetical protein